MLGKDMRTDRHFNPTALIWTPGVQRFFESLGFRVGKGDPFVSGGTTYYTADFSNVSDPVAATIAYIDKYGFFTSGGKQRWDHTAMSKDVWDSLTYAQKRDVVRMMYQREGGNKLGYLFEDAIGRMQTVDVSTGERGDMLDVSGLIEYPTIRLDGIRGKAWVWLLVGLGVVWVIGRK